MTSILRISTLGAIILATPLVAFAQSNAPTANMGSNKSATAPMSAPAGVTSADTNATPKIPTKAEKNPHVPGATGTAIVPGTSSTAAGDRAATADAKTGVTTSGSGK